VTTTIDGEVLQDSNTEDMIFSCAKIIAFLSQARTVLQ
jgi:2-keto-4-pentenoate hydratase/2-oxohepta-3-ene-1,7-dioic acid hydratase in catechol pathway